MTDEALFLSSLPVIDEVSGHVCRRHRLSHAEAEDFRSEVRLHFLQDDYAVLRRFEGRSSLATYVTVVIQRLVLDYRNRLWGRWRPSVEATRLGPTAILLERLVARDGHTIDQAIETLKVNHGIEVDAELSGLVARLAKRMPGRRVVAEEEADALESPSPAPDANILRAERGFLAKRVQSALDRARQALTGEEQLILKMRFENGTSIADIARILHLDQRRLYRRLERLLARLGASLEAEGISRSEVADLLAEGGAGWRVEEPEFTPAGEAGGGPPERLGESWLPRR